MNPVGTIGAFRADTGKPIWSLDLDAKYEVRHGTWALAENILVDDDRILCLPGGRNGSAVAIKQRQRRNNLGKRRDG